MNKFVNFLKTKWKIIVIVILTILLMNKCTVSCTRGQKIKSQTTEIIMQDSLIVCYEDSIKYLNIQNNNLQTLLNSEQKHSDAFNDIATSNQIELQSQFKQLQSENKSLKTENKRLLQRIEQLQMNK